MNAPFSTIATLARQHAHLPLRVRELSYATGDRTIIDKVDLDLGAHGCTTLIGPNGAGKSTLLKLLHGLLKPDAGSIDWLGLAPQDAMRCQAFVFQKPVLLRRTVAANIDFVLKSRGKDRSRAASLLEEVGLTDKAMQPARLLSGGEQQLLALARALATDPKIMFLDEPTASLDPFSVQMIERIISRIRARGVRLLFVTHDMGQARRISDDVVFLHRGKVVEHAPADCFFPEPMTKTAREYLGGKIVV